MDLKTAVQPHSNQDELSLGLGEVEVVTHDISKEELCHQKFSLSIRLACVENLHLVPAKDLVLQQKDPFYFNYDFLGENFSTEQFYSLDSPEFVSENATVMISTTQDILRQFLSTAEVNIKLCHGATVLAAAELQIGCVIPNSGQLEDRITYQAKVDMVAVDSVTVPEDGEGNCARIGVIVVLEKEETNSEMEVSELSVNNSKVDLTSHSINSCTSDTPLLINNSAGAPVSLLHPGPPPVISSTGARGVQTTHPSLSAHQDTCGRPRYTFEYDELQIGLTFGGFEEAESYIKRWCDVNKLPLIKRDSCRDSETRPGRILYECPHRTKRKYSTAGVRERQHVNFTACESHVNIYQSMKDKLFKVTKCIKDHTGHLTGSSVYGSYPTVRIMSESTQNKVNQLEGVGASRRRVADVIGEETGNIIIRDSWHLLTFYVINRNDLWVQRHL
jgi:hypothetical protein